MTETGIVSGSWKGIMRTEKQVTKFLRDQAGFSLNQALVVYTIVNRLDIHIHKLDRRVLKLEKKLASRKKQ